MSNSPVQELETTALALPDQARALVVETPEQYESAGGFLLRIKDVRGRIDATFNPIIAKAHDAHKEALAQKKKLEDPLIAAEGIIKPRLAAFNQRQETARREQERKEQEAARKRAEKDQLKRAVAAEAQGNAAEAEQILNTPVDVPAVVKPSTTPTVAGIAHRTIWKFRVVDERQVPREYLRVDDTKIGAVVRALKGEARIAGVEVYAEQTVAAGAMR